MPAPILYSFQILLPLLCIATSTPLPDDPSSPSSSSTSSTSTSSHWSKGKQVGVIVGCVVGGAIILFLWGWVLKGGKMWHGEKYLWAKSHFGFSEESRLDARVERETNKRKRKEERDKFWGQPARTKPTRAQEAAAAKSQGNFIADEAIGMSKD